MTDSEKAKTIDAVMDAVSGDLNKALAALAGQPSFANLTRKKLANYISNSPELAYKWTEARTKKSSAPVAKRYSGMVPAVPAPLPGDDVAPSDTPEEQDRKFRDGLAKVGLSSEKTDYAASLQSFNRNHYSMAFNTLTGGVVVAGIEVSAVIQELSERIAGGFDGAEKLAEEQMCLNAFFRGCEILMAMAKTTIEGESIRVRTRLLLKPPAAKNSPARAGFAALQKTEVNNVPGGTINVNVKPDSKEPTAEDSDG